MPETPSPHPNDPFASRRAHYWQWIALAVATLIYSWSLAPTTFWLDSAQLQVRALEGFQWSPDARQYPLFVLLARLLTFTLDPVNTAWGLNALTAALGCVAVFFLFDLLRHLRLSPPAALAGSLAFTAAHTVWYFSVITEVYTLFLVFLFGTLRAAIRWTSREPRFLPLTTFLLSLGLGHHRMMLLAVPPLAVYLWLKREHITPGAHRRAGLSFAVGLFPLASWALFFLLQGHSLAELTHTYLFSGINDWRNVMQEVSVAKFQHSTMVLGVFFTYNFFGPALMLGLLGVFTCLRKPTRETWLLGGFGLIAFVFALDYSVEDQWAFFLPLYAVFAIWVAMGFEAVLQFARARDTQFLRTKVIALLALIVAVPMATYHFTPVAMNAANMNPFGRADARGFHRTLLNPNRQGDRTPHEFAARIIELVPPDTVLLCDAGSHSVLRYYQLAEGLGQSMWLGFLDSTDPDYLRPLIAATYAGHEVYVVLHPYHRLEEGEHVKQVAERVADDVPLFKVIPPAATKPLLET